MDGSAWVSFNGFDRKQIQYSFKDRGGSREKFAEPVVQDPPGKQTVLASWAGTEPEGKYRLADVMTGNYSLMLRLYYGAPCLPEDVQLGSFPGKTAEISGTPLFDETINGSNYTNILVDRLQVSTNIPMRFYRVRMQP